jgi:elongation factor G
MMHANDREDVKRGLDRATSPRRSGSSRSSRATRCAAPDKPIRLETMTFPEPVIKVAIEPKTKSDQEKMSVALGRLAEEDPTFACHERGDRPDRDLGHGRAAPRGARRPHAARVQGRRERGAPAGLLPRDRARQRREGRGRFVKQTGGSGQFGIVYINIEPAPGEGFDFVNKIKGGSIPTEYIPAVEKGVEEALESGVRAGYPMVDVRVTLTDGKYHDTDSSEIAFKIAARSPPGGGARAKPVLLEPIFSVEVVTPEDFLGDVIGDLSRRRGRVESQDRRGNALAVTAKVPLSEMFGYVNDLRSNTQGRANYTMQFDSYDEVPPNIAEKVVGERTGEAPAA